MNRHAHRHTSTTQPTGREALGEVVSTVTNDCPESVNLRELGAEPWDDVMMSEMGSAKSPIYSHVISGTERDSTLSGPEQVG